MSVSDRDRRAVALQLGREPRAMREVAHRCPCGNPDVVETAPRLPDGSPFPTLYYLTCPKLASRIGTLESDGLMREMTERLAEDPELQARYDAAATDYVARRDATEVLENVSPQGGMPLRVKCLHVLVAHSLAVGEGVNPFGDEALQVLPEWWAAGPCVDPEDPDATVGKKTPGVTRVAAVDCGTNSVRLLVTDLQGTVKHDLQREMRIVRLGQGVDRTGELAPEALERTRLALVEYAELARRHEVQVTRMVATSATRDARNRDDFVRMVVATLGVEPEVVSGDTEAALSFDGATRDLPATDGPFLVMDIGGGSTELVLGSTEVQAGYSMDVGCVRLTERHLQQDPPSPAQVAAAEADVEAGLARVRAVVPVEQARTAVGLAGSVTTVAAHALRLERYDADALHLARLPAADVVAACRSLEAMTRQQRAALPYLHPGRVDVIGAGALVLRVLVTALELTELVVSERDILDGIAWSAVRASGG